MILNQRTMHPIRNVTESLHKRNPKLMTTNQMKRNQLLVIQRFSIYWIYQQMNQAKRIAYWTFLVMQQMVADQIMRPHNHHHQTY